jgi:hypothetical protein
MLNKKLDDRLLAVKISTIHNVERYKFDPDPVSDQAPRLTSRGEQKFCLAKQDPYHTAHVMTIKSPFAGDTS